MNVFSRTLRDSGWVRVSVLVLVAAAWSCKGARERLDAPNERRFEYSTFALTLDVNWACSEVGYGGSFHGPWEWNGGGVRCRRADGLFVDVLVDVGMSPPDADGHWLVRPLPDGRIEVVDGDLCVNAPPDTSLMYPGPSCRRGDGRLEVFMSFKAGGHAFVLDMGHGTRESEQLIPDLRRLVASFRYKPGKP